MKADDALDADLTEMGRSQATAACATYQGTGVKEIELVVATPLSRGGWADVICTVICDPSPGLPSPLAEASTIASVPSPIQIPPARPPFPGNHSPVPRPFACRGRGVPSRPHGGCAEAPQVRARTVLGGVAIPCRHPAVRSEVAPESAGHGQQCGHAHPVACAHSAWGVAIPCRHTAVRSEVAPESAGHGQRCDHAHTRRTRQSGGADRRWRTRTRTAPSAVGEIDLDLWPAQRAAAGGRANFPSACPDHAPPSRAARFSSHRLA